MIKIENLTKSFSKQLFKNLTVNISNNGLYKVSGFSGAGKSTLFKTILNIETPDEGKITIDDIVIDRKTNSLIGKKCIFLSSTGLLFKNISFSRNLKSLKFNYDSETLEYLLNYFDAKNLVNTKISRLSEGQCKILNIIYVLSIDVNYYFLDEPFGGIDQERKKKLKSYLLNLSKTKSIIFIDHEGNIKLQECNLSINIPESTVNLINEAPDIAVKNISISKKKNISFFTALNRLLRMNKVQYIFYTLLLSIATSFLGLGVAFYPYNDSTISEKIDKITPNEYYQAYYNSDFQNKENEFDLLSSADNKSYFISINTNDSIFFTGNKASLSNFNFDTEYRSSLIYLIEKNLDSNEVYYEKDSNYEMSAPLINIGELNNNSTLDIKLLGSDSPLSKSNKFIPYNANTIEKSKDTKRTDYLHFSTTSFVKFFNEQLMADAKTPSGNSLLDVGLFQKIEVDFIHYTVKLTEEKDVFSIAGKNKGETVSIIGGSNLTTTQNGDDLPSRTLLISLNNFKHLFDFDFEATLGFINKNDTDFVKNHNLQLYAGLFENYKNQDLLLSYSIAFFIVGVLFTGILIIYVLLNEIKMNRNSKSTTMLKSLGVRNKEIFQIHITPYLIISIIAISLNVILLFAAMPIGNKLAYQSSFTFEISDPLYSLGFGVPTIYDSLSFAKIRDFSFYGLLLSLCPSVIMIFIYLILRYQNENRIKKHN